jgi:hypothetical protein
VTLEEEVQAALDATTPKDWSEPEEERGFKFVRAVSSGWTIRLGYGRSAGQAMQDGTAVKEGVILHLTPAHARLARLKATGECCIRGLAGLHNALCPKEGFGA